VLDLNYLEDKDASVDMNLVMTDDGNFVEVQGAGEETTFSQTQLDEMLELGRRGIVSLFEAQQAVLASATAS
jgi:ribonuclease PH